jgi:hypothetical protein
VGVPHDLLQVAERPAGVEVQRRERVPHRLRAEVAGQVVRQPGLRGEPAHRRLYLLLDQQGHHVRGFVPKTGLDDPEPNPRLGALIRERIMAGASR